MHAYNQCSTSRRTKFKVILSYRGVTRLNPGYIGQTLFQTRTKIKLQIKGDWLGAQHRG